MILQENAANYSTPLVDAADRHLPKLMYDRSQVAEMLGISKRTVDNLIAAKQLTARKVGSRVLIPFSALVDFTRRDHPTTPTNKKPN